jgi:hypothetical protein
LLAEAVLDVISDTNSPLPPMLSCCTTDVFLPFENIPTREQLLRLLEETHSVEKWMEHFTHLVPPRFRLPEPEARAVAKTLNANELKSIHHQLDQLDKMGSLPSGCNMALGLVRLGESLSWFHLGGEPVVDYSLAIKRKLGASLTWVSGYFDDLLCYVPSERVLEEGDYEGRDGMREYGHPSPFEPGIERRIMDAIDKLRDQAAVSALTRQSGSLR